MNSVGRMLLAAERSVYIVHHVAPDGAVYVQGWIDEAGRACGIGRNFVIGAV